MQRRDITHMLGHEPGQRYERVYPGHWPRGNFYEVRLEQGSAVVVTCIFAFGWKNRADRLAQRKSEQTRKRA